jgi:hypothetical protein
MVGLEGPRGQGTRVFGGKHARLAVGDRREHRDQFGRDWIFHGFGQCPRHTPAVAGSMRISLTSTAFRILFSHPVPQLVSGFGL